MPGARLSTKSAVLWLAAVAALNCAATLWWIHPGRNPSLVPLFLALEILGGLVVIAISVLILVRLVGSKVRRHLMHEGDVPWRVGLGLLLTMILGNAAVIGLFGWSVSLDRLVLTNVGLVSAWIVSRVFIRSRRQHNAH